MNSVCATNHSKYIVHIYKTYQLLNINRIYDKDIILKDMKLINRKTSIVFSVTDIIVKD